MTGMRKSLVEKGSYATVSEIFGASVWNKTVFKFLTYVDKSAISI